jgi:uncharacterized protein YfkK (UPF0435 family)
MSHIAEPDMPDSAAERVAMLEGIMISAATGGSHEDSAYSMLRSEFMNDPDICDLLPHFVRKYRTLSAFWPFIKEQDGSYAGRRQLITEAFTPLIDQLEAPYRNPADAPVTDALDAFSAAGVSEAWRRALNRRATDPEGAITAARTLLETVCKHVLDRLEIIYSDKEDLPKLYAMVARELNLAPSQHTEEPIRAVLGGAMNLVNGLGTLRNRLSDSHGRGGKIPVKPAARHASLAVNSAGALAAFIVETFEDRHG